jgi:hypothetical protein
MGGTQKVHRSMEGYKTTKKEDCLVRISDLVVCKWGTILNNSYLGVRKYQKVENPFVRD